MFISLKEESGLNPKIREPPGGLVVVARRRLSSTRVWIFVCVVRDRVLCGITYDK